MNRAQQNVARDCDLLEGHSFFTPLFFRNNYIFRHIAEAVAAKPGGSDVDQAERNLAKLRAELQEGTPKLQRYMANDATIEKLGEILRDNPDGRLVFRDELYGFLMGFEKQGRETERTFHSSGVPATVVMKIAGWKDMKTMQRYIRMAGIDEAGAAGILHFIPTDEAVMEHVVNMVDYREKK